MRKLASELQAKPAAAIKSLRLQAAGSSWDEWTKVFGGFFCFLRVY
jgi:hypothetical protein